ncbi:hypothetical protein D7319_31100 [Streptomyces radicis]|uniref:Uncharacterized protein n=2 Tax=Streptomyces radicis TaxID=1750517 RepID=A0A3A9VSX9_9ACTN|nr:hypothetical protein D7319_31100 [Streptomyces radicis]RKN13506.1 hypothetical protein D7318_31095 [Streptomyces radicis]
MMRVFEQTGLGVPPVPDELRGDVRQLRPWAFATRGIDPMAMYMFDRHPVDEALAGPGEDYMAVCHAGHGANSYAVTYHLVFGPLALFAQTGWGGAYMDSVRTAVQVREQFRRCAELAERAERLRDLPRAALGRAPRRLIVADSALRRTAHCGWLDEAPGDQVAAQEWFRANRCPRPARGEDDGEDPFPGLTEAARLLDAALATGHRSGSGDPAGRATAL